MTFASVDDAFAALPSVKAQSDIIAFVKKLSVEVPGVSNNAVMVLYTGKIGDANAYEFVNKMPADIRRLDARTMAVQVLESDAFNAKVAQAFGLTPVEFSDLLKDPDSTHPAKLWMKEGGKTPWGGGFGKVRQRNHGSDPLSDAGPGLEKRAGQERV